MTDQGHQIFGWIAAGVTALAYPPYIVEFVGGWTKRHPLTRWMWTRLGLKGGTQPRQVSWLIWGALQLVILLSSRQQGASATTAIVLIYLIGSSSIGILSLKYGEKGWTRLDVACGFLGTASMVLLFVVKAPFWALLLAIATDGIAAIPTAVAVTANPEGESRVGWSLFFAGAVLNLFAVKTWNFQEAGYTFYLIGVIGYVCANAWRPRRREALARGSSRLEERSAA